MISFLKDLGLNNKESQVYLATLELNKQPASLIAKRAKMNRSTAYVILEQLIKKRFVRESIYKGIKHYQAISPEEIIELLEQKKTRLEEKIQQTKRKLPEFEALQRYTLGKPQVRFFEGREGIKEIYEEMLEHKAFNAFFHTELADSFFPDISAWFGSEVTKRKIHAQEITKDTPGGREYKKSYESKKHQVRIAPKEIDINSDCFFLPEKFVLISYGKDGVSAVSVENEGLAQGQNMMFEGLWKSLKD